ncbi:amidase domain-containing protein [Clostridium chauvoei]|uniref:Peptidase C51 domain-containing protein n=2 Tax=Clostridium chauvoei TaxID=46867 RepID=S6F1E6_9CLOT|nr:amidase domain-containing protein [Clostridium chauvoei]ATD55681.1 hypothetical protein BTM20_10740 [Clostridium chauvoei]ATD56642.1 hypothetical protein BTM21_02280 [Clostridium chauvoei]MBX7280077.1 amidase domain-containing protein [Clostridium chauvoei]MBX7282561.1 amidase domain-containing protein [Clostridium chauvoei]MBX7284968.1 amidase domain-containing protein [Clostridium chauvoei]
MKSKKSIFPYFRIFRKKKNIYLNNKTIEDVEEVLLGYFNKCIENERKLKLVKNKYIYPNSILEEYNKLHYSALIDLYSSIKARAKFYHVYLNINSINRRGKTIEVDVDKIINIKYKNSKVLTEYKDNHLIYLNDKNGELFVSKDINEEGMKAREVFNTIDSYEEYIKNKIRVTKKNRFNLKSKVNKKIVNKIGYRHSTYDGTKAAKWASDNWNALEEYEGNDCTNFVSKALNAGGLSIDSIWKPGSYAWIRVISLRNWLVNTGYAKEYKSNNELELGDVVQLYSRSKDKWSHSTIITSIDSDGQIYVSAHSYPYHNRPLFSYYPTYAYANIRFLKIT